VVCCANFTTSLLCSVGPVSKALYAIMSKHETWRTRKYWESVGGFLIEEYRAISPERSKGIRKRHIDGVIVLGEANGIQIGGEYCLEGKDIIVVQTKSAPLGMYLMGQALFSREIMERFNPRSIRTVAICSVIDPEMEKICNKYDIEVVEIGNDQAPGI